MRRVSVIGLLLLLFVTPVALVVARQGERLARAGDAQMGGIVVPSAQVVAPSGDRWTIPGRPVDVVRRDSDGALFIKTLDAILKVNPTSGEVVAKAATKGGASLHGLTLTPDGQTLLSSDADKSVHVFDVASGVKETGAIKFDNAAVGGVAYPCGIAVSTDGSTAYVCLSRSNALATVDLKTMKVTGQVKVAPAPFDVALKDGTAVVSCWGRDPNGHDLKAPSSGTPVAIDKRGIATGGVICFVQLGSGAVTRVNTAHQPSQIVVSKGGLAYIPCPSDDLLTEWNVAENRLVRTLRLNPGGGKFLGVAPNALAFSPDESKLFLACGSYNAIGVVDLASGGLKELGYLSADWYPIGVAASSDHLWAINAKGIGSRGDSTSRRSVYSFTGTISSFAWPVSDLASETQRAMRQATALKDEEAIAGSNPLRAGSPIEHVFYIIKENRTYDQVLGDMPQGDGDPKFLEFGRAITPNAHAISSQFALLDNFYCNGVNSADGHSWATEGNASSFFERSFGGFTRSYPFVVDDPLIPNPSGFLWNNALRHGKSFLNYGESDYAGTNKSFAQNLADLKAGKKTTFTQNIPVSDLKDHSLRDFPGWNLEIPDQVRAARFIEDFRQREAKGTVPSLSIIYLPEDHTGASVSPSTCVADNDYATGLVIEAITHSKVWAKSAIFVVEDDAQAGVDHVDGHRSPCLVVSPYTPRGKTLSHFYSQVSVLHTIELILGLPPMNRFDQLAPPMVAAFDGPLDLTPYEAVKPKLALQKAPAFMRNLALNFKKPDQVDPSILNRLIWRATRPGEPYPVAFEGSNDGRLAARGLVRAKNRATKRDDD